MLPVKENRAALFDAPDALPWAGTPIGHESTDTGHGRTTRRTIRVLPAPSGLPFPHVHQVWLIERYERATGLRPRARPLRPNQPADRQAAERIAQS
ncbi:hypothetical protein [Micromonospora sp. LOL_023]|uniref:hypothetical protein n=1 Tax=Micromonospora sp. LOL_023 TaxID=3345418 RepID=UPI003A8C82B8